MTDQIEIAIYAEHTSRAGRIVPDPNSLNRCDKQIFAGTPVELAELAREYCQLTGAQHAYLRKCGRVILDELYSTGAIERPIWDECDCAEQWVDIANDVLADCGIGVHSDDSPQIWYDCRSIVNSISSYDMVSLHEPDVAIDIPDWQDLNRQDIRVVAHRYLQTMTHDLKSQIIAAIEESEQWNRVPIVETSATTKQVDTVLKSFDCDWVSWHDQHEQYLTDCWSLASDDNEAISKWRIEIKHTC